MLNIRCRDLRGWLSPSNEVQLAPIIARLSLMLSKPAGSDEDAELRQRMYAADLSDLPYFAVEQACEAFRRGMVGDGKWLPTAAEIRLYAERKVEPLRKELLEIEGVLTAEVVPAQELDTARKQQAINRLKATMAERAAGGVAEGRKPFSTISPDEAEANLKQLQETGLPPIELSPSLRAAMKLQEAPVSQENGTYDDLRDVI